MKNLFILIFFFSASTFAADMVEFKEFPNKTVTIERIYTGHQTAEKCVFLFDAKKNIMGLLFKDQTNQIDRAVKTTNPNKKEFFLKGKSNASNKKCKI